jgi:hypothetical protein
MYVAGFYSDDKLVNELFVKHATAVRTRWLPAHFVIVE